MTDVDAYDAERPGIDRRTIIKRAAATGAVAWTAPMILGSMASPAGAITAGPCDFYVFRMQREGGSGNCGAAIASLATCPTPTITGASTACTSFTRQTSTTTPVNFTVIACSGGATETATFTINTAGRVFVGQAQSGPSITCSAAVALGASSGTQTAVLTQAGLGTNGVWWAYLAVGFA
jgi:hypothetical protein